jgi:hypothetical protein
MEEIAINSKFNLNWNKSSKHSFTDDYTFVEKCREEYKVIVEGIGTFKTSRRQNKVLNRPFLINKFDTCYLYEK